MQYISYYASPLGELLLSANEAALTGVWFADQRYAERYQERAHEVRELPVLRRTKEWLSVYFSGQEPDFSIPTDMDGTEFQREVWAILRTIPYGETTTYGAIAEQLAQRHGRIRMSAQAVGGAVGRNRISILIPCHRVVGADGALTGYAGGIERKRALLALETSRRRTEL